MSSAHLHLVLNHVPVVGVAAAAVLLTLAVALRRDVLSRAGLWSLVASGVLAVPVYLSGNAAEDVVEELGVAEAYIEAHEEAGLVALVGLLVLGAMAASALWLYRHRDELSRALVVGLWLLSLGAGVLMARTANLGGEIRHPEIRGELFGEAERAGEHGAEPEEDAPGDVETPEGGSDRDGSDDAAGAP